jgi:CCR4-NOT transcription complex subunit 1
MLPKLRTAITKAVQELIELVVASATNSTAQLIRKDFATEQYEERVRSAAVHIVEITVRGRALVESKASLRMIMINHIRALSRELALPESAIVTVVDSNLDIAWDQVKRIAAKRAVQEIEEIIKPYLEARRHHRITRSGQSYYIPGWWW